jgi:ribosome biogenesis GTPase A
VVDSDFSFNSELYLVIKIIVFACACMSAGSGYMHVPDLSAAANHFIKAFRNGDFGRVMLDTQQLTYSAS